MNADTFIDTNILVYAHDSAIGRKQEKAAELVEAAWNQESKPALSIQVLQEFAVTLMKRGLAREKALEVAGLYIHWELVENTADIFQSGIRICKRYNLSFWDSMIVAAAQYSGARELLSEDLQHGQSFGHLKVRNPFENA